MTCKACGGTLEFGTRFCPACGSPVATPCTSCGAELPMDARFCPSCGATVKGGDSGAPTAEPARERKTVTMLFADLVGFTAMSERHDPEIVSALVGRIFERVAEEVRRYEGTVEKFAGDAMLAVFGVPAIHEDDPERAVRAALEMQAAVGRVADDMGPGELRPRLRIGINTGEVLVDLDRASGARDLFVTGDAVNTAARLQAAAEPGSVVVGAATYAATLDVVEYEELPPTALKGKADLVAAWRAVTVKARRGGLRSPLGIEAPLVGRVDELAILKGDRPPRGRDRTSAPGDRGRRRRRRQVAPDLGAGEVPRRAARDVLLAQGPLPGVRAGELLRPGGRHQGRHPGSRRRHLGGGRREARDARLAELAAEGSPESRSALLATLGLEGETLARDTLVDGWTRYLGLVAAVAPLVLVFEDIHWADEGLLDFIEYLARWGEGPIAILCLARHELFDRRPTWGGGIANAATIVLEPLSAGQTDQLIDGLLAGGLPGGAP